MNNASLSQFGVQSGSKRPFMKCYVEVRISARPSSNCASPSSLFEIESKLMHLNPIQTNVAFLKAGGYLVAVDRAHHPQALNKKSIPAPGQVIGKNIALQSESGGAL
jgi:hypothetical protein